MTENTNGAAAEEQRRPLTIGGATVELKPFMAFKAMRAMRMVRVLFREHGPSILAEGGRFKREFEGENYTELDRAEARRMFPPRPLTKQVPLERDGELVFETVPGQDDDEPGRELVVLTEPALDPAGQPLMRDPLGHLTDQDWEKSGNKLRVPESPDRWLQYAVMAAAAIEQAEDLSMQLLALILADDRDLERWDTEGNTNVDAELQAAARTLPHRARADEFVRLLVGAAAFMVDQLGDTLNEVKGDVGKIRAALPGATTDSEPEPEAMQIESSSNGLTSSTSSEAATTGPPSTSSTASPGASSES